MSVWISSCLCGLLTVHFMVTNILAYKWFKWAPNSCPVCIQSCDKCVSAPFGNAYNLEHKCWCPIVVKWGYFFKFGQVYTRFQTLRQLYTRSEWSILPSTRLRHAYLWVASPLGGAPHPTRWLSPPWVEESSKNGPENAVFRAKKYVSKKLSSKKNPLQAQAAHIWNR